MTKQLELLFKDANDKPRKITVRRPKDNLTPNQAEQALNAFIQTDVFIGKEGEDLYAAPVGARYVTRTVDDIYEAPTA